MSFRLINDEVRCDLKHVCVYVFCYIMLRCTGMCVMVLRASTDKCVVIGMQTTGESALRQSQDYDDLSSFSTGDDKDVTDEDDFISSPAITLQNVILKCFPRPAWTDMPKKKKKEYEKKKEMRLLQTNMHTLPGDGKYVMSYFACSLVCCCGHQCLAPSVFLHTMNGAGKGDSCCHYGWQISVYFFTYVL